MTLFQINGFSLNWFVNSGVIDPYNRILYMDIFAHFLGVFYLIIIKDALAS